MQAAEFNYIVFNLKLTLGTDDKWTQSKYLEQLLIENDTLIIKSILIWSKLY